MADGIESEDLEKSLDPSLMTDEEMFELLKSPLDLENEDPEEAIRPSFSYLNDDFLQNLGNLKLEIDSKINQILKYNYLIYDAQILAVEQVQDKRIEWLEEGPEASISEVIVEGITVFLLGSPTVVGMIQSGIQKSFRYLSGKLAMQVINKAKAKGTKLLAVELANIKAKKNELSRLIENDQRTLVSLATKTGGLTRMSPADRNRFENHIKSIKDRIGLNETELQVIVAQEKELIKRGIRTSNDHPGKAILAKQLNDKELQKTVAENLIPIISAGKSAIDKSDKSNSDELVDKNIKEGQDSFGVMLSNRIQEFVRNSEAEIFALKSEVDIHFSLALSTRSEIDFQMLEAINKVLSDQDKSFDEIKFKEVYRIQFEQIIWAFMLVKNSKEKMEKEATPLDKPNFKADPYSFVLRKLPRLPQRTLQYLNQRFYPHIKDFHNYDALIKLAELKEDIIKLATKDLLFVEELAFKEKLLK